MGASNSTMVEEDKALQLCRERKKLIGQALDCRCSLAAAHISYIEALKVTGTALRSFVEHETSVEPSIYATSEVPVLNKKYANGSISTSSSPPATKRIYQTNHMKFGGNFSRTVEEKPSVPQIVSVTSVTPQSSTPRSTGRPETPRPETPRPESTIDQLETPPWDYFGLFNTVDKQVSSPDQNEYKQDVKFSHEVKQFVNEEGTSELGGKEDKFSSHGMEDSSESDEFDEPVTPTLVRTFENVNRVVDNVAEMVSKQSIISEATSSDGQERKSSDLMPSRGETSPVTRTSEVKTAAKGEHDDEDNVAPMDFFSSIKDIEYLFSKASDSGKEVPRMLEANKFHFRPMFSGNEGGSLSASLFKYCFSCGEDPSQVQEEPQETSVKYLTWHRTTSSRSSSSRNLIESNDIEDLTKNLLDSLSMVSRSHASTLDRLFAWEKKLYDEVKASQMIRRHYDKKCKLLRQQESKGENPDKTRSVVKDLHSRVRVAIQRINSVSKKIEELRDTELQPQLEELIQGLRKMWEVMLDCHKLQFHVISVAYAPPPPVVKMSPMQSDPSHRQQVTIHLVNEVTCLSSCFSKWIGAQKTYVEAIDKWLLKCVSVTEKYSKRKRRIPAPPIRNFGPPIYVTTGIWLEKFNSLPTKEITDSIKSLAVEISYFLPHQEKHTSHFSEEDVMPGFDHLRITLVGFLGQLINFAESSVHMFAQLQKAIQDAKKSYHYAMSK